MDNRAPSLWTPALIGGGALGVVGGIPLIGGLNCACCSLVVMGGLLAAFLYSKQCRAHGATFDAGAGAKVGLAAAPFYTLAHNIVGGIFSILFNTFDPDQILEQLEQQPNLPPEALEAAEQILGGGAGFLMLIGFFVVLVAALIFSTIGGLIGGAVFKVQAPEPSAAPPAPPPLGPSASG